MGRHSFMVMERGRFRWRRMAPALGAALALSLAAAPASSGAVTIGSSMPETTNGSLLCNCTTVQRALPGRLVASPVNGTVVRWRIRAHPDAPGPFRLRVVRPLGASSLFLSSSSAASAPGSVDRTFATALPISIGDRIGVDLIGGSAAMHFADRSGAARETYGSVVANGATATPSPFLAEVENLLNADVEPTNRSGARLRPRSDGTALLIARLPNPGRLVVRSGPLLRAASAVSTQGRRVRLIKPAQRRVGAPRRVRIVLQPTGAAKRQLRRTGRARGRIRVAFTPSFGSPRRIARTLRLRRR